MANIKTVLSTQVGKKQAALKTGTVTGRTSRGLLVTDDATGASMLVTGDAATGSRVSYRFGALVAKIPAQSVTVVTV